MSTKYQKKQQTIVGIDYSLNSPAICIAGDDFDFKKVTTNFFDETDIKITVTGNDGQTGTFKLVIDYSTC